MTLNRRLKTTETSTISKTPSPLLSPDYAGCYGRNVSTYFKDKDWTSIVGRYIKGDPRGERDG